MPDVQSRPQCYLAVSPFFWNFEDFYIPMFGASKATFSCWNFNDWCLHCREIQFHLAISPRFRRKSQCNPNVNPSDQSTPRILTTILARCSSPEQIPKRLVQRCCMFSDQWETLFPTACSGHQNGGARRLANRGYCSQKYELFCRHYSRWLRFFF